MKCRATEVIPDKIWITYDEYGSRTGTLKTLDMQVFEHYFKDGSKVERDLDEISSMFDFQIKETNTIHPDQVLGYPILETNGIYNVQYQNELPCFTKTPTGKIFYAAGFYGVKFYDAPWQEVFCPKLTTLKKHEWVGPCKSKTDTNILIKRKNRNYDVRSNAISG